MSQKRFILTTLLLASILTPFIHYTQISAHLTSTTSAFQLPIAPGLNVYVNQGNNDTKHDHVGKAAWAFDFIVGQSNFVVTAAQGGMVIGADDSSIIQCSGLNTESAPEQKFLQDCWTYANYVLIADDDGTTAALYMHLLPHSLKVSSGMHVNQGDPLGLAGTTGWSTGVHLHFQVEDIPSSNRQQTQPRGWWWTQSRPVSFSNPEVLQQDADGVPLAGQSFPVSNPPVVSSPPTPTPPPTPSPTATPVPTPTPTPPTPVLVPTPTPPPTLSPAVTLTPASGSAGSQIQASGTGWPQGELVDVYWETGGPVASVYPDATGLFQVSVTVPSSLSPGPHQVWFDAVDGLTGKHTTVYLTFQVTSSGPQPWDCNHLSVPAIAFYAGTNFAQPEICFEGSGSVNLQDYGWANRAQSINIGVSSGCFYDGANETGNSWCFSGSFTKGDLGSWDNHIVSFQMN